MRRLPSSPPAERSQGKESGPTGQPTHLIVRVHVISQTKYQLRKVPFATSRGRKEDGGLRGKYRNKRTKLRMSNISQILPRCTFYLFIGIYLIYSCSYLLSTAIKRPSIQCDSKGTFHSVWEESIFSSRGGRCWKLLNMRECGSVRVEGKL